MKMLETINRIKQKNQERDRLLEVLSLWAIAKAAGYEADEIKSCTFRKEFLTKEQKKRGRAAAFPEEPYNGRDYHNCVRLVNDELKPIPLTKRPSAKDPS